MVLKGMQDDLLASVSFDGRGLRFPSAWIEGSGSQTCALEGEGELVAVGEGQSPAAWDKASEVL